MILMSGSTSVYPLETALAKAYLEKHPGSVKFRISQGGSDIGIGDVARKRVSIGASSRDLQSGDPGGLVFSKIARDGVCVVTHPSNGMAKRLPAAGAGHLLRQAAPLGRRRGGEGHRPDQPHHPHAGIRHPGRVPQHLHGPEPQRGAERVAEVHERPRPGRGAQQPPGDRLRRHQVHRRHARRAVQGRGVQPAQRQVRPVPRRAQLLVRDAGAPAGVTKKFVDFARSAAVQRSRRSRRCSSWPSRRPCWRACSSPSCGCWPACRA